MKKDDAEPGPGGGRPLLDAVRPGDAVERSQVGGMRVGRAGGGGGAAQVPGRAAAEPGGEAAAAAGHGQVPLGPRHQGADPGGGVQRGLRGAPEAAPHLAPWQETLQDRDPQTGYLLHLLPEPRVGRLKGRGSCRKLDRGRHFVEGGKRLAAVSIEGETGTLLKRSTVFLNILQLRFITFKSAKLIYKYIY